MNEIASELLPDIKPRSYWATFWMFFGILWSFCMFVGGCLYLLRRASFDAFDAFTILIQALIWGLIAGLNSASQVSGERFQIDYCDRQLFTSNIKALIGMTKFNLVSPQKRNPHHIRGIMNS